MSLKNLTIAKKLWLLSGAFSLALLAVGGLSLWNAKKLESTLLMITHNKMPAVRNMTLVDMMHDGIRGVVYTAQLAAEHKDEEALKAANTELAEMTENISKYLETLTNLELSHEEKIAIEAAATPLKNYQESARLTVKLANEGKISEANEQLKKFEESFSQLEKSLGDLGELIEKDASTITTKAEADAANAKNISLIVLTASLLAGAFLAFIITSNLVNTLTTLSSQLETESSSLGKNAVEISAAATELASSSTEQATAVQETAASIEEIGTMVRKTQDNAVQLAKIVEHSYKTTADGKENIQEMLAAIEGIKEANSEILQQTEQSNKEISEIVAVITEIGEKTKVINDIVFQTKLLSFNASVEAARAGEHGKGFAVVAEEVGNLAQMSGNASTEISSMLTRGIERAQGIVANNKARVEKTLSSGQEKITRGSDVANRCDKLFDQLSESMRNVSETTGQISEAIREQSQGTAEISKAIHMFNESSQQNQSVSVRTSDIAQQLSAQSNSVKNVMEELKKQVTTETKLASVHTLHTNKSRKKAA